jgi:hypothetical protein
MRSILLASALFSILLFAGCKKDNFKQPSATISGRVVYEGQPLNLRSNGVQLEIWQRGYQFFTKIPVYVDQEGNFSAAVFDGNYKLTFLKGNGPWVEKTDTIDVTVKGSSVVDVPVTPYFLVGNETFTFNAADTSITTTYKVNRISTGKNPDRLALALGFTNFVDITNNTVLVETSSVPADLTQTITQKVFLNPARYPNTNQAVTRKQLGDILYKKYAFVRIGVRAAGQGERIYSKVQKINL